MSLKCIMVCLCVCVALASAIPIPSDKSILDGEIGEQRFSSSDMDSKLKLIMPQAEKGIDFSVEVKKVHSDKTKKRIQRSIMPRVCRKGEIRINGQCWTCSEAGRGDDC